jgi:hypothetical protein
MADITKYYGLVKMIYLKSKARLAVFAVFSLLIISCGGGGSGSGSGSAGLSSDTGNVAVAAETGTVTLLTTDADTDEFKEINVTVTKAELLSEDGSETLFRGEKTFNLLALAEVTEVFSVSEVAVGNYNKIRLTISKIELVFHDERESVYPKLTGNGKLDLNPRGKFYVDGENPLTVQLDFDAEKSTHIAGPGKGNDKYSFRPVVFVKIVESEFDTKLIRQEGQVRNLDTEFQEFDLCLIEGRGQPDQVEEADEETDCVRVNAGGVSGSIFGESGNPMPFRELENGGIVTVVGRFHRSSQKEEFGDSEDDASEDDVSEDDVSEDDASEGGKDRPRVVLVAELIWSGTDISRSDYTACTVVSSDSELDNWYQNSEVPVAAEEECEDETSRPTVLQPGSKIYSSEGKPLDSSAIRKGIPNRVDGFNEDGTLKAVLVVLDLEEPDSSERSRLTGIVVIEDPASHLTLITDEGDRCVNFHAEDTGVFVSSDDEDDNIIFSEAEVSSLDDGQRATAFGVQNSEGCLDADTIIRENGSEP